MKRKLERSWLLRTAERASAWMSNADVARNIKNPAALFAAQAPQETPPVFQGCLGCPVEKPVVSARKQEETRRWHMIKSASLRGAPRCSVREHTSPISLTPLMYEVRANHQPEKKTSQLTELLPQPCVIGHKQLFHIDISKCVRLPKVGTMQDALAMLTELSIPRRLFKSSVNAPEPASHVSGLHGAGLQGLPSEEMSEMPITNHTQPAGLQVPSRRIHGEICTRGQPFNSQPKPYLRAPPKHISKSWRQRETKQQKAQCKSKYSEGKRKSPKPLTWAAFVFTGIRNSKQKAQAEKPRQIKGRENVLTDLCEVKLPNFTEFHLQAEVVSPADSIKDELETLPGSNYWHSLPLCFHSHPFCALSIFPVSIVWTLQGGDIHTIHLRFGKLTQVYTNMSHSPSQEDLAPTPLPRLLDSLFGDVTAGTSRSLLPVAGSHSRSCYQCVITSTHVIHSDLQGEAVPTAGAFCSARCPAMTTQGLLLETLSMERCRGNVSTGVSRLLPNLRHLPCAGWEMLRARPTRAARCDSAPCWRQESQMQKKLAKRGGGDGDKKKKKESEEGRRAVRHPALSSHRATAAYALASFRVGGGAVGACEEGFPQKEKFAEAESSHHAKGAVLDSKHRKTGALFCLTASPA
ncbi:hypothetical protein Anapl_07757 [Anas platyrhynchos]|uniref:Uncharacterized protein n=1 Tax=Anas platyrhynchos TaxID=8839 RepID=R0LKM9_ANAPL|nr:hypothetical protein Anapl_07757 [Anas platyrhynchos]